MTLVSRFKTKYIHQVRGEKVYTEKLQDIVSAKIINCTNPVTSRRCGRPSNQYLSEGETLKQNKKQK